MLSHGTSALICSAGLLLAAGCWRWQNELAASTSPDGRSRVVVYSIPHAADADVQIALQRDSFRKKVDFVGDYCPSAREIFWQGSNAVAVVVCSTCGSDILYGYDFAARQDLNPLKEPFEEDALRTYCHR